MSTRSQSYRVSWLLSLLPAVLSVSLPAQCPDPALPPNGFRVTEALDQSVIYGDGAATLVDVRYPMASPGPCGWPVVMLVHGGGQNKDQMAQIGRFLAERGYLTAAYDVRGRGSMALNPPELGHMFLGSATRLDMVEMVQHLATTYPGVADTSRLGMSGASQGGQHSWVAAAWSGRPLPPNSRGLTVFPTFKAVYPMLFAPLDGNVVVPEKKAMLTSIAQAPPTSRTMQPAFESRWRSLILAQDFAGLDAIWSQDPWRMDREYLRTSIVPTMVHVSWNDYFMPVERSIDVLDSMPATTPTRAFLSPWRWHDDVTNQRAIDQSELFRWRWFDRFLKGIQNQVDVEPRFVSAVVPPSLKQYQNPSTLLWNRYSDTWPPSGSTTVRYYLRQGGILDPEPPAGAEPTDTVRHRVAPEASMAGLLQVLPSTPTITAWFPTDTQSYTGPVLTTPTEIAGSMRVVLDVVPTGPNYQLHAAIYQVTASGAERFLQSGVGLVRDDPAPRQLAIDIDDIRALLLPGERIRLKIENTTGRSAPGGFKYYVVPYFDDVDVGIVHTAARPSWFDVPVMNEVAPALSSSELIFRTRRRADMSLRLESTSVLAGSPYVLLIGASGMTPGFALPGGAPALLNIDGTTSGLLPLLGGSFLPNGLGTLDATGTASPAPAIRLGQIPEPAALAGLRGIVLGVVGTPSGWRATNPLEWVFF